MYVYTCNVYLYKYRVHRHCLSFGIGKPFQFQYHLHILILTKLRLLKVNLKVRDVITSLRKYLSNEVVDEKSYTSYLNW